MGARQPRRLAGVTDALGGLGLALLASALLASRGIAAPEPRPAKTAVVALEAAPPLALPTAPPDPPLVPLGARFDSDASLPSQADEAHHTELQAALDPVTHIVHGTERVRFRNRSRAAVDHVYLHLYLNAFKNSRSAFLRKPLGDGRGSRRPSDWGYLDVKSMRLREPGGEAGEGVDLWPRRQFGTPGDAGELESPGDETDVRVPLPAPCAPGDEIELSFVFDAKLPSIIERTGHYGSFHMVAQWFPKLARLMPDGAWSHFPFHRLSEFDADFGSYDVTLDVPEGFEVGATGELASRAAVAGRVRSRFLARSVHDFAWTAWDHFTSREERIDGVAVRVLSPPGHGLDTERELETLRSAIGCFARRFGPYPYPGLTVVHPPRGAEEAGGMEYPTLITTGGVWWGPPFVRLAETVTIHEFGHQYFYGMLASDERRFPFLDEGINSYAEGACLGERWGQGSALDAPGLTLQNEAIHREGALGHGHDDAVARGADTFPSARHYARLVYSRTASLLRTLGGAYGRDTVDRALGRYARAYRFGHPDPRHLLAAFGDAGGAGLEENLRVGLLERGWVDYAVVELEEGPPAADEGLIDSGEKGRELVRPPQRAGHEGWALVVRRGTLKLPVEIRLLLEGGESETRVWDGQANWVRLRYEGPRALRGVIVDPDHKIELDERFSNNAMSAHPALLGERTFERAAYLLGLLAQALAP